MFNILEVRELYDIDDEVAALVREEELIQELLMQEMAKANDESIDLFFEDARGL
jgi:hypothetical protein